MRGGFTFDRWIGRDHQFLHVAFSQTRREFFKPQFARTDTVERAEPALQYEIQAAVAGGLLDDETIRRRFHRAQQMRIARCVRAGCTEVGFAEIAAARAVTDAIDRGGQRIGKTLSALTLTLKHVISHPLRGFLADSGQDAKGFDQLFEKGDGHRIEITLDR